jgi:DNA invertase Pin-like site-specific DNA recombinase
MDNNEKRQRKSAFGYTRTSSATNLGEDKDSVPRQRRAIQGYANRAGYKIAAWYDDGDVKGADPIDTRPGFTALLEAIAANGCRTIVVETANRFARDLVVQETGYQRLKADGIELIAADSPEAFTDDTPTAVLIRQILGAVAQFDKAQTVAKLRGAREKQRAKHGKCEGRKSWAERSPAAVEAARSLAAEGCSLREIAARLAAMGHVAKSGKGISASRIASMLSD